MWCDEDGMYGVGLMLVISFDVHLCWNLPVLFEYPQSAGKISTTNRIYYLLNECIVCVHPGGEWRIPSVLIYALMI